MIQSSSSGNAVAMSGVETMIKTFSWSYVPTSLISAKVKPRWPNPEKSIGDGYQSLGRNSCWEAIGLAREAFCDMTQDIKCVLESRNEYLNEGEQVPPMIMFGIYMIGRSEVDAQPTLLFSSSSKKARRKAMKLIKRSSIPSRFPGVLLAESSQPPHSLQPPQLLASGGDDKLPYIADGANTVYTSGWAEHACGAPIFISKPGTRSLSTARKATMGGVLRLKGEYYGLTVAHVFLPSAEASEQTPETCVDFAFDDDHDSDLGDDDYTEMTSRGSTSPDSKPDSNISTEVDSMELDNSAHADDVDMGVIDVNPDSNRYLNPTGVSGPGLASDSHPVTIGTVLTTSARECGNGLDWALIAMHDRQLMRPNVICLSNGSQLEKVYVERVAGNISPDGEVLAVTGSSGVVKCRISGTPFFMRMPGGSTFQETKVVQLEGQIMAGDCGSWVVDAKTGDVYGHIVAGHPGSRVAYIIPAHQIYDDIKSRFGSSAELPTIRETSMSQKPQSFKQLPASVLADALEDKERHMEQTRPLKPEADRFVCPFKGCRSLTYGADNLLEHLTVVHNFGILLDRNDEASSSRVPGATEDKESMLEDAQWRLSEERQAKMNLESLLEALRSGSQEHHTERENVGDQITPQLRVWLEENSPWSLPDKSPKVEDNSTFPSSSPNMPFASRNQFGRHQVGPVVDRGSATPPDSISLPSSRDFGAKSLSPFSQYTPGSPLSHKRHFEEPQSKNYGATAPVGRSSKWLPRLRSRSRSPRPKAKVRSNVELETELPPQSPPQSSNLSKPAPRSRYSGTFGDVSRHGNDWLFNGFGSLTSGRLYATVTSGISIVFIEEDEAEDM